MKKFFFLPLLLISLAGTSRAQGNSYSADFNVEATPQLALQDKMAMDSLLRWEERVYLHTDREQANAGEYLFFKAYVFNGPTQMRFSPSGVLRLELRDSENALVSTQYHPVVGGAGEGVVRLPKKLEEGEYELLAYTRWMKNYGEGQFFRRTLKIGKSGEPESTGTVQNTEVHLEIYPEGGRLLAGIPNRVVVAARTPGGTYGSVQGHIADVAGNPVVAVQAYSEGYGMAIFQPRANESYSFIPAMGPAQLLPAIQEEGYSLHINTLSSEKIRIEVLATESLKGEPVILEGRRDGQSYFIHVLEFDGGSASLEISKASLPQGLMTFYLTGMDQVAWAERPVWIDSREALNIQAEPLNAARTEDGEIAFRIRVTDAGGKPVQTDLSVAVNPAELASRDGIDQYLKPVAQEAANFDDRRIYFIEDLKAQSLKKETAGREIPDEIRYPVERSLELHGTAYDLENVLLANTEIQMLASSDSDLVIREMKTDAAGVLHVSGLDVVGETQFIFRTKGEAQKERLVKIIPIKEVPREKGKAANGAAPVAESKMYRKSQRKNPVVETTPPVAFDTTGVIRLREATVIDKRKQEQAMVPSLYGIKPNPRDVVYQDLEKPLPIDMLILNIPGVQVRPTVEGVPVASHLRRGGGGILWVVDGQIIRTGGDPYLSPLTFLTPLDIFRIEFIIDAGQASIFGVQAPTGVMIVYTRSGNFLDIVNRKEGGLNFKGFEPTLEFDAYMADRKKNRRNRNTAPSTLYWNPSVQTDKNGEAVIRFTGTGAEFGQFQLSIETLTPDGRVGAFRGSF